MARGGVRVLQGRLISANFDLNDFDLSQVEATYSMDSKPIDIIDRSKDKLPLNVAQGLEIFGDKWKRLQLYTVVIEGSYSDLSKNNQAIKLAWSTGQDVLIVDNKLLDEILVGWLGKE